MPVKPPHTSTRLSAFSSAPEVPELSAFRPRSATTALIVKLEHHPARIQPKLTADRLVGLRNAHNWPDLAAGVETNEPPTIRSDSAFGATSTHCWSLTKSDTSPPKPPLTPTMYHKLEPRVVQGRSLSADGQRGWC